MNDAGCVAIGLMKGHIGMRKELQAGSPFGSGEEIILPPCLVVMVLLIGLEAENLNVEVLFFFDVFDVEADVFDLHVFFSFEANPERDELWRIDPNFLEAVVAVEAIVRRAPFDPADG